MPLPGISLTMPGRAPVHLEHLALDYNGTLARHGKLLPGVAERLRELAKLLAVHVVTADTFGSARGELERELPAELFSGAVALDRLPPLPHGSAPSSRTAPADDEAQSKLALIAALGPERCCAMGNGANDGLMLGAAALSVCVMGREGCAVETLNQAMICVTDIRDGLDLLLYPGSCVATLRR